MEQPIRSRAGYRLIDCSLEILLADNQRVLKGEVDGFNINPANKWNGRSEDLQMIAEKVKVLSFPLADKVGLTAELLSRYKLLEKLYVAECSLPLTFESACLREFGVGLNKRMAFGNLPKLEFLYLRNVSSPLDPPSWPNLASLKYLGIVLGGVENLAGLERLHKLVHLDISYLKRLVSITTLKDLPVKHLWIQACSKISDWGSVLPTLRSLQSLRIINCGVLKDLSFLLRLNLREFRFGQTKVLDGDLSLLDRVPYVAFDDARHYNIKKKNFEWHDPSPGYQV